MIHFTTPLEAAREYLHRGWAPLPVLGGKNPGFSGWQRFTVAEEELPRHFRDGVNIGLLLGSASGSLVNVDLDCAEARRLAPHILPATAMRSGRRSTPDAHWWYESDIPGTVQFRDPALKSDDTRAMLVELRSTGARRSWPRASIRAASATSGKGRSSRHQSRRRS